MGTQQLLLIVLSLIIVSVTIVGAIGLFKLRAQQSNRSAIIQDMYNIAVLAISYNKTTANMGGGAGSWDPDGFYVWCGYPISNNGRFLETDNGRIRVQVISRDRLRVKGWGTELGYNENQAIRARLILSSTSGQMNFRILN
ncbi:MAG: hypothetical protein HOD64_11590 [Candidatus Cloacimonetes bacterium]|jgi:hypothetical protein|nr:hypothetical protein [Candidatus Cloacimonadota bacterium]MBT4333903.1 hypothetical protein [Candidatus Cloacimonadota bacterium]